MDALAKATRFAYSDNSTLLTGKHGMCVRQGGHHLERVERRLRWAAPRDVMTPYEVLQEVEHLARCLARICGRCRELELTSPGLRQRKYRGHVHED